MTACVRRREFITLLGGAAAVWPLAASAQQSDRMRRIGVFMGIADDSEGQARVAVFRVRGRAPALRFGSWLGLNINYQFRGAASYVDRLLKGAKAADLPVEQPTKLEFVINLKTAKSLGLTVPTIMQMTADEVIE
jgi:hypothetical protein